MIGLLDWIKIGAGAALGAFVASGPLYLYGVHNGRQQAAVAALEASVKAYKDRNNENAAVQALSPVDLCVELGGLRLDCEAELCRLGADSAEPGVCRLPVGK